MTSSTLRDLVHQHMPAAFSELSTLVGFTSVADERQYPKQACLDAAHWVRDAFHSLDFNDANLFETPDGSYAVIGHAPHVPDAPTVLLYCHYDVQPPLDDAAWNTPPFTLTEKNGRWYGRGAADCKGNIIAHLIALRALRESRAEADTPYPLNLTVVAEGSEETTGGLDDYVPQHVDQLQADAILLCDTGNVAVGNPTLTTSLRGIVNVVVEVKTLQHELHSGMFGGPAPDALTALVSMLSQLHDDAGDTTIKGLAELVPNGGVWQGAHYDKEQFRADAEILDGAYITGSGTVADSLWAKPALTILGIDAPQVVGSAAAVQPSARARLNLRVPPGVDPNKARDLLVAQLTDSAPWGATVNIETEGIGSPFSADTSGPAYTALMAALEESFGKPTTTAGQGGSIPLATTLASVMPKAEIALMGVEEPICHIHAPNESVDPSEIEHIALAEALFLAKYHG